jgi:hypothetical protein
MQELQRVVQEELAFYQHAQYDYSPAFQEFLRSHGHILLNTDFQYLMVPTHLVAEFRSHLDSHSTTEPVYEDKEYHHYLDPIMDHSLYRFCRVHQVLPLFQGVQTDHTVSLQPEYIPHLSPILFRLFVEGMDPDGLAQWLPHTTGQQTVCVAQRMLRHSQKFPLMVGATPTPNWLAQQGCPLSILERLHPPLRFPVQVQSPDNTLFPIDKGVVEWCFQTCGSYPFDQSLDQILMSPSYRDKDHSHYVSSALRHGHHPTDIGFSVLLKKTDLRAKDLFFLDYATQQLKNNRLDMEIWSETAWQENQDKTIELLWEFSGQETLVFLVIHLCMNMMDILYADMDYWALQFRERFSCYMKFIHLVRFRTDQDDRVRHVDKRIVGHVLHPPPPPPPPMQYPPFCQRHPQTIVFSIENGEDMEVPVYRDYLGSGLIDRVLDPRGFKPTQTDPDHITLCIPDILRDPEKTICDWVMFSYLKQIHPHSPIEDVLELFRLSQYLMDGVCEEHCEQWLDQAFMEEFAGHRGHRREECGLCQFWHRS